jgi:hypothetical protein
MICKWGKVLQLPLNCGLNVANREETIEPCNEDRRVRLLMSMVADCAGEPSVEQMEQLDSKILSQDRRILKLVSRKFPLY